jgi:hypothetical protein
MTKIFSSGLIKKETTAAGFLTFIYLRAFVDLSIIIFPSLPVP